MHGTKSLKFSLVVCRLCSVANLTELHPIYAFTLDASHLQNYVMGLTSKRKQIKSFVT